MNGYNWKEQTITEEVIDQYGRLSGDEVLPIIRYEYPFFEWYPGIETKTTMGND